MKKYSWLLALVAIFAIAIGGFVSCKDDDGGSSTGGGGEEEGKVTITFNAAGGTLVGTSPVVIDKGGTLSAEQIPTVNRAGFTFKEWNSSATAAASGIVLEAGKTTHDASRTYFAIYNVVSIEFDANGGSLSFTAPLQIPVGGTIAAAQAPVATMDDYDFVEWNTQADGEGDTLEFDETEHDVNTKYYAQWVIEPSIKVLYDLQNDPNVQSFNNTTGGVTHTSGLFRVVGHDKEIPAYSSVVDIDEDTDEVTLIVTGRDGSSHGVRLQMAALNAIAKPGRYYKIEYGALLRNPNDSATAVNQGRFRLEGGTVPPAGTGIPMKTSTNNVILLTEDVSAPVGGTVAISLEWIISKEEIAAMGSGEMSFGETRTNADRHWGIEYTNIKITQIRPEPGECLICKTAELNPCTCDEAISDAKYAIEEATFTASVTAAGTEAAAITAVSNAISALGMNGVFVTIQNPVFVPAVLGTEEDTAGSDGSLTFDVNLKRGIGIPVTITGLTMTITTLAYVLPYEPPALAAGETLLYDMQIDESDARNIIKWNISTTPSSSLLFSSNLGTGESWTPVNIYPRSLTSTNRTGTSQLYRYNTSVLVPLLVARGDRTGVTYRFEFGGTFIDRDGSGYPGTAALATRIIGLGGDRVGDTVSGLNVQFNQSATVTHAEVAAATNIGIGNVSNSGNVNMRINVLRIIEIAPAP